MNHQLSISFDVLHLRENNPLSEQQLNEHQDKFTEDCFEVLKKLLAGERLTVKQAIITNLSGDLRRRIKDLRDYGFPIKDKKLTGGSKEYFLSTEDKSKAIEVLLRNAEVKKAG